MLNRYYSYKRAAGATGFFLVTIMLIFFAIFPQNADVPTAIRGCYIANKGSLVVVGIDFITDHSSGVIGLPVKYIKTNLGPQLSSEQGTSIKRNSDGTLGFYPSKYGKIISIENGAIVSYSDQGDEFAFKKARCDEHLR